MKIWCDDVYVIDFIGEKKNCKTTYIVKIKCQWSFERDFKIIHSQIWAISIGHSLNCQNVDCDKLKNYEFTKPIGSDSVLAYN